MKPASDKIGLIDSIRRISTLIYVATLLCFGLTVISGRITFLKSETDKIREEYTESQKNLVKTQVETAVQLIDISRSKAISKDNILELLSSIRFGADADGYIFVNTYDGIPLLLDAKIVVDGDSIWDLEDPDGVRVIQEEKRASANPEGDFIYYSWLKLSNNTVTPKVSFIKGVPECEWMVGAGIYLDSVEKDISLLQKKVFRQTVFQVSVLVAIMLILLVVFHRVFKRFTKNVEREISLFSVYFDNAAVSNEEIDISSIRYREFAHIAEDMNQMVNNKLEADQIIFASEQRLHLQREQSPIGYIEYDKDFRITYWNPFAERIFGYSRAEIMGESDEILIFPENLSEIRAIHNNLVNASDEGDLGIININDNITKDGRRITCKWYNKTVKDKEGNVLGIVSIVDDITEKKLFEDRLAKSLEEKQILIKEVHHRVKNNMAIISAFISLQSGEVKDENANRILQSVENRIRSMALIHEYLYKTENIKDLDVKSYIDELIIILLDSYKNGLDDLSTNINIMQFDLDLDLLVPLGLLINEIISNALKHAFINIESPELTVSLVQTASDEVLLSVSDNGVGLPPDSAMPGTDSVGFLLINSLVLQMGGRLEIGRSHGTEYRIFIPLKLKSEKGMEAS